MPPSDLAKELIIPESIKMIDVSASSQLIQHKPENTVGVRVNTDKSFLKNSESFWAAKGGEYIAPYNTGAFLGKGDNSNIMLSEFVKRFVKVIEQILRQELSKQNRTTEEFNPDIKAIQIIFNLLLEHMKRSNCEVKNEEFMAVIHGFVNSYINSVN